MFKALHATDIHHADAPFGAGHIMGTCGMGVDPKQSVVDTQLRLHGHRRCFVISIADFPSVGMANPTLTLAALSLRAVDAIRTSLNA